jgi:heme-degrading monooxygenase HmoA
MYAVIFEVEPEPDRVQEYLDIAARLRAELEQIEGFISIERFTSLSQHGKILSLSFWRDEDAIAGASRSSITQRKSRGATRYSATTGSASLRLCAITACMNGRKHRRRCRRQRVNGLEPGYSHAIRGAFPSFAGPRNNCPFWIVNAVVIAGLPSGPAFASIASASRARPASAARIRPLCTSAAKIWS